MPAVAVREPRSESNYAVTCHQNLSGRFLAFLLALAAALLISQAATAPRLALAEEVIEAPSDDGASFTSSDLRYDAADPCIIKVDDTYYLFATTEDKRIPYYYSTDLKSWALAGNALSCSAFEGTGLYSGQYSAVWSPEVRERTVNGRTTYVLTYTAADYRSESEQKRICVAVADKIAPGAFGRPKMIDTGSVQNAIDSDLYFEGNDIWLYFKNEDEYRSICVERLGQDWSRKSGPTTVLRMDQAWESWTIEGPWVFKWGSTYYLMYSSGGYTTDNYCVGYATASSPDGPFTKVTTGAPLVRSQMGVIGPGHNTTLMVAEGEMYLVYHSLYQEGNASRRLMIDRMGVDDDGLIFVNFAGFKRQPLPSGTQGYYQVPADDYDVLAHGVQNIVLNDVVTGQSDAVSVGTVDTSSLTIEVADGYKVSDLWLFGTTAGLSGTAELVINGEQTVSGYELSGTSIKLTLPDLQQYIQTIEVRLSQTQTLSEVLLVSLGERWAPVDTTPSNQSNLQEVSVESGVYELASAKSGSLVVDVTGASKANGAKVQLYASNTSSAQRWRVTRNNDGTYTLINVCSGKALEVSGGAAKNGAGMQQYVSNGTAAQRWKFYDAGDGHYYLASLLSTSDGKKLVLDIPGGNAASGKALQVYRSNQTIAQQWVLRPVSQTIADGTYVVQSQINSRYVLDVVGGSLANGANVQLYASNGTAAQQWKVSFDAKTGYYTIANAKSGKVLDVAGAKNVNGANVQQYPSNKSNAQLWTIAEQPSGGYQLRCATGGRALDVSGGVAASGRNVQIYNANGSKAQTWTFVPVE